MKNKRIIILTAVVISLSRFMIFALSKIFTEYMGTGNETENTLNAEIENAGREAFDYPYINFMDLKTSEDEKAKVYVPMFDEGQHIYYCNEEFIPDENMLTHQQAANTFGEAVKYIYGYTGHTNNPVVVAYDKDYGNAKYPHIYAVYYIDTERNIVLSGRIDPLTGQIAQIINNGGINIERTFNNQENINKPVSDELYGRLVEETLNNLELLGFKESIDTLDIFSITHSIKVDDCNYYHVVTSTSNSQWRSFNYISEDNEYFELMTAYNDI